MRRLILASTSPRRAALLHQIGVPFIQRAVEVDESPRPDEVAAETALRLAMAKAKAGMQDLAHRPPLAHAEPGSAAGIATQGWAVLAADTLVSMDGEPLDKPRDREHFLAMLRRLSGRRHEVFTAVALAWEEQLHALLSVSHVEFRPLDDSELAAYWASQEPQDKAGGYAIQGLAASFITRLEGSCSGVMGLPLYETAELLRRAGIPLWSTPR